MGFFFHSFFHVYSKYESSSSSVSDTVLGTQRRRRP